MRRRVRAALHALQQIARRAVDRERVLAADQLVQDGAQREDIGAGVDLPGRRLIGAFVATLGLPQFDAVNKVICERMQTRFGSGYDYTYLFPGIQKVVQAAGRVIRTQSDTGTVMLLDDRYQEYRYRKLLPAWWRIGIDC